METETEQTVYKNKRYRKFISDMESAGIPWRHYEGKNYYSGPAAVTSAEFTASGIRNATEVTLVSDTLGRNIILHPR